MQLTWYAVLALIGVVQALFFAFALWTKRDSNPANRFLAGFVFIFSVILLDLFLSTSQINVRYPNVIGILWPAVFFVGPLFWWYTRALTDRQFIFDRGTLWHLLPAFASFIGLLPVILLRPELKRALILEELNAPLALWPLLAVSIVFLAMVSHTGIYVFWSLGQIRQHNRNLEDNFSAVEDVNLRWLNNLAIVFFVNWLLFLLSQLLPFPAAAGIFATLSDIGIIFFVFAIGFFATRQTPLVVEVPPQATMTTPAVSDEGQITEQSTGHIAEQSTEQSKYQSSTLSDGQAEFIKERLLLVMNSAKPYRQGKLTLPQLATQLNVLPNYLSQVINERLACNFFEFVNAYRIEEAKTRLIAEPTRTVLDIALDVGFNSKSAFYKVFKEQCGLTPSQYRAAHRSAPHQTTSN